MKAFDFFPTPITVSDICIIPEELEKLMSLYNDKDTWVLNKGNNYRSNETDIFRNVLGIDSYLFKQVQNEIDLFSEEIMGEEASLITTQSWLNFNPTNTSHERHFHTNSIVSGIVYIRTDDKTGNINFHKPLEKFNMTMNQVKKYNKYNFEHIFFTPLSCQLFLFPSYLNHSVDKNESETTRISLAFNTFYSGSFGAIDKLNKASFSINEELE
jgi:uncharacterized protein (TIGR02466 family)